MSQGARIDAWDHVFHEGPAALTKTILGPALVALKEPDRQIVKLLVEHVCDQTKWIAQASAELVSETARIRDIGITMQRAGLRSYTDKEGRIYVAPDKSGPGHE